MAALNDKINGVRYLNNSMVSKIICNLKKKKKKLRINVILTIEEYAVQSFKLSY